VPSELKCAAKPQETKLHENLFGCSVSYRYGRTDMTKHRDEFFCNSSYRARTKPKDHNTKMRMEEVEVRLHAFNTIQVILRHHAVSNGRDSPAFRRTVRCLHLQGHSSACILCDGSGNYSPRLFTECDKTVEQSTFSPATYLARGLITELITLVT